MRPAPDPPSRDPFVHLHAKSWYSFLRGASSPAALVKRAVELGQEAVAVMDWMTVAGAVQLEQAAKDAGVKAIVGAEVLVAGRPLVLLCASRAGYSSLCRLLTRAKAQVDGPSLEPEALADDNEGLILLTGGREGTLRTLLVGHENHSALEWARRLKALMPGRVFVELSNHRRPLEDQLIGRLASLARVAGLPCVATGDAAHARPEDAVRLDLVSCIRLGITVHHPHPERPVNQEAHLKSGLEMEGLVFDPTARANTVALARECAPLGLLADGVSPPGAVVPEGVTADDHLQYLCRTGFERRYPPGHPSRSRARQRLVREL